MQKRIGVLLSGCGVLDGSEIHEAVLTLLSLDKIGAKTICMAPDINQEGVIDHFRNKKMLETRNVLVESARIARGNIVSLNSVKAGNIDGLILPGGLGAVTNLSNFSSINQKVKPEVHPQVKRLLSDIRKNNKPIGAICIAPATVVQALSDKKPSVTIGNDIKVAKNINNLGGSHSECNLNDLCVDNKNMIVSTPAYMLGTSIKDIALGIDKLVRKIIELCKGKRSK